MVTDQGTDQGVTRAEIKIDQEVVTIISHGATGLGLVIEGQIGTMEKALTGAAVAISMLHPPTCSTKNPY